MLTGPAAERLAAALDGLDAIIAGVRRAALDQFSAGIEAGAGVIDGPAGETSADQILGRLLALAGDISDSCAASSADRRAAIQVLDARHSLYRALIDLTAEPSPQATVMRASLFPG